MTDPDKLKIVRLTLELEAYKDVVEDAEIFVRAAIDMFMHDDPSMSVKAYKWLTRTEHLNPTVKDNIKKSAERLKDSLGDLEDGE